MSRPRITDVSEHQSRPSFTRMKREDNIVGAVAKMSEGWGYIDPDGEANLRNIVQANLVPGAYHFLWRGPKGAGKGGRYQADFFLRQVRKVINPAKCLLFVDVEISGSMQPQYYPRFVDVRRFLKRLEEHFPEKRLGIYSGYYWRGDMGNPRISDLGLKRRPILWDANYFNNTTIETFSQALNGVPNSYWNSPAFGGRQAQILQFSDRVRFSEYVGDADAADVTLETLKGWVA